jgi:hypothetical protein
MLVRDATPASAAATTILAAARHRGLRGLLLAAGVGMLFPAAAAAAPPLEAGVARVDVTDPRAAKVHDPAFAKCLVLRQGEVSAVLVTVDAVAIGGIGPIPGGFLESVRAELARDPGIPAAGVIVNASHCHAAVRPDCDRFVVAAVREAWGRLGPVTVAAGAAEERRISENRRAALADGTQVDMRRAYAFAWADEIVATGPIDPQVGLLRVDRADGRPLAVVYVFACHPIMNPPAKGSSADFPAAASGLVEAALGADALAFFVQGCGGDVNPARYKDVTAFPDAAPLGRLLGGTVVEAARDLGPAATGPLAATRRVVPLPRAADHQRRIARLEAERARLVGAIEGTNVNFESFLPLLLRGRLPGTVPASTAAAGPGTDTDAALLAAEQSRQVEAYLRNVRIMERLTRLNTNLALLERHAARARAAASDTLDVELCGLRIGEFRLVTFPGELTCEVGLDVKRAAGIPTAFVAGCTNGYIHYAPTVRQRENTGFAQEDCDCMVAAEWQRVFETAAVEILRGL